MKPDNDELHAKCSIQANWILEAALRNSNFSKKTGQRALRAVEAALFMLGYDFPALIDNIPSQPKKTQPQTTREKNLK